MMTYRELMAGSALLWVVALAPAPAVAGGSLGATIIADTNRDGLVNDADLADKTEWTSAHGAIMLPNIGDKARRCPKASDKRFSDAQLEACHDADDDVAHAPENLALVRTLAIQGLSPAAWGSIRATGPGAAKVRVFMQQRGSWIFLKPETHLSAKDLAKGVILGVDARDIVRDDAVWDGRVDLEFNVVDGTHSGSDRVAMRVAPVVIHNHLQKAIEVVAPESGASKAHAQFVSDLKDTLKQAGFATPVLTVNTVDNWAQDIVEFGYVGMPKAGGGITAIRIAIRSPQPKRLGGRALFDLRGEGMGVVQVGGEAYHQADSFGNLEAVPPYALNGKTYPVGRVIYGDAGDGFAPHKDFVTFFRSQEAQSPITLDTSWLAIAHVDEFIQFVPADNARGWTIAVKDVASALKILRAAQASGHGSTPAFSRPGAPSGTIDQLLSDRVLLEDNEMARRRVELNLEILKSETGVSDDEIIRVPGLFHESDFAAYVHKARERVPPLPLPKGDAGTDVERPTEEITYAQGTMIAYYPAAVNGLLLDRHNYIPPKQWGPVVNGVDIMEQGVKAAYAKVGIKTWFVDDWLSHHSIGGEVHCGTNAIREITGTWWTSSGVSSAEPAKAG